MVECPKCKGKLLYLTLNVSLEDREADYDVVIVMRCDVCKQKYVTAAYLDITTLVEVDN